MASQRGFCYCSLIKQTPCPSGGVAVERKKRKEEKLTGAAALPGFRPAQRHSEQEVPRPIPGCHFEACKDECELPRFS